MTSFIEGDPRRFCRKCLLRDMPGEEYFTSLKKYIEGLGTREKVPSEVYEQRLSLCRECAHLLSGMCRKCGCFVELRAAMRKNSCPDIHPRWEREPEVEAW